MYVSESWVPYRLVSGPHTAVPDCVQLEVDTALLSCAHRHKRNGKNSPCPAQLRQGPSCQGVHQLSRLIAHQAGKILPPKAHVHSDWDKLPRFSPEAVPAEYSGLRRAENGLIAALAGEAVRLRLATFFLGKGLVGNGSFLDWLVKLDAGKLLSAMNETVGQWVLTLPKPKEGRRISSAMQLRWYAKPRQGLGDAISAIRPAEIVHKHIAQDEGCKFCLDYKQVIELCRSGVQSPAAPSCTSKIIAPSARLHSAAEPKKTDTCLGSALGVVGAKVSAESKLIEITKISMMRLEMYLTDSEIVRRIHLVGDTAETSDIATTEKDVADELIHLAGPLSGTQASNLADV
eukprot:g71502.t1